MRKRHWLIAGLFLCLTAPIVRAQDAEAVTLPAKDQFYLFLLVGQSNMAGRGVVSDEDREIHPRVLVFDKKKEWIPAADPLHFDRSAAGTGLGKTFAIEIAKDDPDVTVGLIPCAVGGTPISSWEPGVFDAATNTHPWDDCMARVKVALPAGELKGILWHQGESDCKPDLSKVYSEKLKELVVRFRRELNAPDVPFIVGQMGQFPMRPWTDSHRQVDGATRDLPNQLPRIGYVNSDGLNHKGDSIHFDSAAYRELGRRYANEYFRLTDEEAKSRH
ncbi:sialate O-acetylesterase [Planctomicrobium sp. SH661]|uniref:sialate O-acetylesterase n=1 Tax=Planctomicrobium sp. SH661 TaxID=3448124 RepID=UPI003F5B597A